MTAVETRPPEAAANVANAIDGSADRDRRRHRSRRVIAVVVVLVAAAVALVVWRSRTSSTDTTTAAPPATAVVATKSITNDGTFDGTVAHTTANPILAGSTGRITALAPSGTVVENGQPLYSIDGTPVVLLTGVIPAWRDMTPATPAGPDVTQLQLDLKALGFDPSGYIAPGSAYDAATQAAVVRWQTQLGVPATGDVRLGSIVFQPSATTIGVTHVALGSSVTSGTSIADASIPAVSMQFTIPADVKTTIAIGQVVDVTLPDRTNGKGTIRSIGTSTDATTGAVSTVGRGTVDPPRNAAAITDGAAIKVRVSQVVAQDVPTVPGSALTNHLDGTFTVAVMRPDGSTNDVVVKVGASSNGVVQITGEGIGPGTKVLIPSG